MIHRSGQLKCVCQVTVGTTGHDDIIVMTMMSSCILENEWGLVYPSEV